jgi:hypothetical protein
MGNMLATQLRMRITMSAYFKGEDTPIIVSSFSPRLALDAWSNL